MEGDVELGDAVLGSVELGLLDELPLFGVAPRPLEFFRTKPPAPAELLVACWTQPVIVTGDPYVELAA